MHEYKLDTGVTVRGRLVRDGAPVPNANVCIVQVDRNSRTFLGTQTIGTDVSGKFELTNVRRVITGRSARCETRCRRGR